SRTASATACGAARPSSKGAGSSAASPEGSPLDSSPMDPAIDAKAPLRISFVGGGTDFPHWYREHGGAVLSATIDHFVRVRVIARDDRRVRLRSLDLDRLVEYHLDRGPVYDGVMDLAKAAIDRIG